LKLPVNTVGQTAAQMLLILAFKVKGQGQICLLLKYNLQNQLRYMFN